MEYREKPTTYGPAIFFLLMIIFPAGIIGNMLMTDEPAQATTAEGPEADPDYDPEAIGLGLLNPDGTPTVPTTVPPASVASPAPTAAPPSTIKALAKKAVPGCSGNACGDWRADKIVERVSDSPAKLAVVSSIKDHFGAEWRTAVRIAYCESGLDMTRIYKPGNGENSVGAFQLNFDRKLKRPWDYNRARTDINYHVGVAKNLYDNAKDRKGNHRYWGSWSTRKNVRLGNGTTADYVVTGHNKKGQPIKTRTC